VKDFDMQLGIYEGQRMSVISPREKWQTVRYADSTLKIVRDYYVELRQSHK
jgi:hypothetical protein